MAYVPSVAPVEYSASFFQEEFNRISSAYNFQRAVGELLFDIEVIHAPQATSIIPVKLIGWDIIGPDPTLSDGPILTDPRLTPDDNILVLEDGIYQLGFYCGFEHGQNETFLFEIYVNDVRTFIGSIAEGTGGTIVNSISASAVYVLNANDVVEVRVSSLTGPEIITVLAGGFFVLKEMDLRTRVS